MSDLASIAQQLDGAHQDGNAWRGKCPVHHGTNPDSLKLWLHDGEIKAECFSQGCDFKDILRVLGVTQRQAAHEPDITYDYHDRDGALIFQVCRKRHPKGFYQRRPDPTRPGAWLHTVKGVEQVPYKLPDVLEAIALDKTIYIVEGEKDAESLHTHGLTATCNAGGAGKWRASHTQYLAGARVRVLADNDKAGWSHQAQVIAALTGTAASVTALDLPDLPPNGDVTDWLQTNTFAAFEACAAATVPSGVAPATEMTAAELLAQDFAPIEWLAQGLLHEGMVLFGGKSKRGKSWVMLNLAASVASGGIAFGYYDVPKAQKVLYCALEDGPRRMQRRLQMIDPTHDADYANLKFAFSVPPLSEGGIEYITKHILDGYKLIVVDVLAHLEKAGKNGLRDYHEVYETFAPLQQLRSDHSFALVMVTHLRKSESEEVFDNLHGSVAYQGAQDALWVLERKAGDDTANLHLRDKDAEDKVVELKFDGGGLWSFVGEGEEYISSKKQEEVVTFLREEGRPMSVKEIMMGLGINQQEYNNFRQRVMRMDAMGLLVKTGRGKYGVLHSNDFEKVPY